jgi:non-ribosomal peptide synthetase-like protein
VLGLRKWIADALLADSLAFTNSLYATLYTVPWLRLLGARIGRGAEVSTAAHLDPDLLTLGEQSFVADMASVGAATFADGRMLLRPTRVGKRAFVGNAALVPSGTGTGDGSLVGVHTVPPPEGVPQGTSWLGSPAMHLPQRQDSGDYDEQETFRPSRRRIRRRLAVEFVRATLPASLLGVALFLYLLALSIVARGRDLLPTALVAPLLAMVASVGVVAYVVAVKRNVVGTYRSRVAPLWDPFVRRTEFVTGLYEAAAVPTLLSVLVGTPFLPVALRRFGARIGRRTWIGTTYLTEFDLVEIGDDAAVGPGVSLQTHLFEDRVMKMSTVRVGAGATVGVRTIVLYDATVGGQVDLDGLSLLMKGEELGEGTRWRGIPARAVAEPTPAEPSTVELPAVPVPAGAQREAA